MTHQSSETESRKWFTEEVRFLLMLGGVVVTITLAWGSLKGDQDLLNQEIGFIKTNHLKHIEADIDEMRKDVTAMKEILARMDEILKK